MQNIKLGCDPEFFLSDERGAISAHEVVPGTKINPEPLDDIVSVLADGTAVEFNVKPATSGKEFVDYVQHSLNKLHEILPDYQFEFRPIITYDGLYYDRLPDMVKQSGCDPQLDAKTMKVKPYKTIKEHSAIAGGHLHIGWTEGKNVEDPDHMADVQQYATHLHRVMQPLAYFLSEKSRKGRIDSRVKAMGNCLPIRVKPYGCEYRFLSNEWLKYPEIGHVLYELCNSTYHRLLEDRNLDKTWGTSKESQLVVEGRMTRAGALHRIYQDDIDWSHSKWKEVLKEE